jgi:hypothetical protein
MLKKQQTYRLLDLAEQIQKVNKMIQVHKEHEGESFMSQQYEEIKLRFLHDLRLELEKYEIKPQELVLA